MSVTACVTYERRVEKPALRTARGFAYYAGTQMLFPYGFLSKRQTVRSLALTEIEAELLEIPPRSPDIDCIENVFHLVKRYLEEEAIAENITNETLEQFKQRVFRALDSIPSGVIDNIILSMNSRIEAILLSKGHRTKC